MRVLVYDTETTGRPLNYLAPPSAGPNWPFIVQLAWAVIDLRIDRVVQQVSSVVRLPKGVLVEPEAAEIHGFTAEMTQAGQSFPVVSAQFLAAAKNIDFCVCHNVGFDCPVVMSNLMRCQGYHDLIVGRTAHEFFGDIPHVCTMVESVEVCKIPIQMGRYKWPRLEELHNHLFGVGFEGAHDALADVMATTRCFLELRRLGLITTPGLSATTTNKESTQ